MEPPPVSTLEFERRITRLERANGALLRPGEVEAMREELLEEVERNCRARIAEGPLMSEAEALERLNQWAAAHAG
jgi:hypothetical protein